VNVRAIIGILVATAAAVSGCGSADRSSPERSSADGESSAEATPTGTPTTTKLPDKGSVESARGRVIKTGSSDFGTMLFDRSGQAIYLFAKERTSKPECYGACATAWPPVLTEGTPQARGDTRSGLLGTTKRRDGSSQVTYNGHPLYFYAHEDKFQVLCHNVNENGGLWLVVTPKGEPAPA